MPGQESSQVRSAQRARSYDDMEQVANPTAARRSWPRWSSMPSPVVALEPGTDKPEEYADDDNRDCDTDQRDSETCKVRHGSITR
jgi:hypothetical protein